MEFLSTGIFSHIREGLSRRVVIKHLPLFYFFCLFSSFIVQNWNENWNGFSMIFLHFMQSYMKEQKIPPRKSEEGKIYLSRYSMVTAMARSQSWSGEKWSASVPEVMPFSTVQRTA